MPGNGDGSFGYITAGAGFYYLSKQQGKIGRFILDQAGNMLQMARIDPDSASQNDYLFIHPFAVNPHNEKELFLPSKSKVWRNKDVTQIPLHNQLDSVAVNIGWEILEQTQDTNEFWAAIAISNSPAHILIVGSTTGRLIKINDCESNNPQVQDITSNEFPKGGFINDIVIDPINADRFMVIFSNYKVKSVFYTMDGGLNFTDISANLEQSADGSGNGPSCRTGAIMTLENNTRAFFIGTSAGLYAADTLIGNQTNWILQAPDELGYAVINDLDFRNSDGQLYVATHGIGMWKATFTQRNQVLSLNKIPSFDFQIAPNPATNYVQITLPVTLEKGLIKLLDDRGRIVLEHNIQGNIITLSIPQLASGIYYIDVTSKDSNCRKSIYIK
jgi:hypothetical protein